MKLFEALIPVFSEVYLGLGSNVGDRERHFRLALEWISETEGIELQVVSRFIQTKAVGRVRQPDFLNAVAKIRTILMPEELLVVLQALECRAGRRSKGAYDPRPLDLDILFFGDQIVCTELLTIPHPLLHERAFVLEPLSEIAPDLVHPMFGDSIADFVSRMRSV